MAEHPVENPYAEASPHAQQTLDLFKGRWASRLPIEGVSTGETPLFDDPRVGWALTHLNRLGADTSQCDFLELGPLEGGHSFGLIRNGVKSVTAIEANKQAFLKCLVAREVLGHARVRFLLGDAMAFLQTSETCYDVVFASGFLYHMQDPVKCLELIALRARALFLWTVYWDEQFARENPLVRAGSDGVHAIRYKGRDLRLHRHGYGGGIDYSRFWGGPDTHSHWMEREDLKLVLRLNGFTEIHEELETNPNGCALKLVATKARSPVPIRESAG